MSVLKDEYILGQSISKNLSGAEAIRIDLCLKSNPHLHSATLAGKVMNYSGKPVADAVVIVLDESYEILASTTSGNGGIFYLSLLKPGKDYHAYAQAPGFNLSEAPPFTLCSNQTFEMDFVLVPDTELNRPVIAGEVHNQHGLPVKSATVELFRVEGASTKLISLSLSNEVGQYVLHDLEPGMYFLKINALGYFSGFFPIEIKAASGISRMNATLKENPKASKGIITGLITDTDDRPLANADVILYQGGSNQSLTPVSYTRTNHEGIYLFVNLPQGEYRVNANRSVILD